VLDYIQNKAYARTARILSERNKAPDSHLSHDDGEADINEDNRPTKLKATGRPVAQEVRILDEAVLESLDKRRGKSTIGPI
jgi:hypothetical protein